MVFSLLDRWLPLSPQDRLESLYALTSFLSAVALALIALWFHGEFGFGVGLSVSLSTVLTPWLTVFGRNLWWSLWAFYLPMVCILWLFRRVREPARRLRRTGLVVFVAVFIKCFVNGYEYITTTLIMMVTPVVYYAIRDRYGIGDVLREFRAAAYGSCLALLVSFAVLLTQIASVQGGIMIGAQHIVHSFVKRTHGNADEFSPAYADSLAAKTLPVMQTYLMGAFSDPPRGPRAHPPSPPRSRFGLRYVDLVGLFFVMSIPLVLRRRGEQPQTRQARLALVGATWFSVLAPLSWFAIFKSHSFIHTHMNYVVWQMPFTLFGFAVSGLTVRIVFSDLAHLARRSSVPR
jgi:hypothetical protein